MCAATPKKRYSQNNKIVLANGTLTLIFLISLLCKTQWVQWYQMMFVATWRHECCNSVADSGLYKTPQDHIIRQRINCSSSVVLDKILIPYFCKSLTCWIYLFPWHQWSLVWGQGGRPDSVLLPKIRSPAWRCCEDRWGERDITKISAYQFLEIHRNQITAITQLASKILII